LYISVTGRGAVVRRITTTRQYPIAVMLMLMAVLAMVALATLAIFASSAGAQEEEGKSILCHRTGSASNPFRVIEVDGSSIPSAHSGHGDFILGPASEFEGKTEEELEGACAEADPRTTAANDQYDHTTAADDQYGVVKETIPKAKVLPDTGGVSVLAPAALLTLLINGAAMGILFLRRH
jgi:hypothetical protein